MKIRIQSDGEQIAFLLEQTQNGVVQRRQEYVRKLARRLLGRVIERTPVDTGRARAGWQEGLGQEEEDGETTKISVTNNVEYIAFLEFGTSRTPARAMVRSSMSQAQADVCSIPLEIIFGT